MTRKSVWTFGLASFFNDLGSDMISPLWPILVKETLGASFKVLGILDGFRESVMSISQVFSGYLSDRFHQRKIFIWLGYVGAGLGRLGYAISLHWWHLFPFSLIDRAGKMRDAPRDAMVADLSDRASRARNFGLIEILDNLGAVVGIVISIILVRFLDLRLILALAAIPSLVSVLLVVFLIKDHKDGASPSPFRGLRLKSLNRDFRLFTLSSIFFTLSFFSYSFLLLFLKDQGFSLPTLPIFYLIFTVCASLFSGVSGHLADRFSRKLTILISFALWGASLLGFIFIPKLSLLPAIILFILYGAHKGMLKPAQSAYVAESAAPEARASVLGFYKMITGLCALPASFMAGLLWDAYGSTAPFIFALVLTILAFGVMFMVKETKEA